MHLYFPRNNTMSTEYGSCKTCQSCNLRYAVGRNDPPRVEHLIIEKLGSVYAVHTQLSGLALPDKSVGNI
jgi:hypothetical protein